MGVILLGGPSQPVANQLTLIWLPLSCGPALSWVKPNCPQLVLADTHLSAGWSKAEAAPLCRMFESVENVYNALRMQHSCGSSVMTSEENKLAALIVSVLAASLSITALVAFD